MFRFARKFRRDETGAVTVDWVVLTAAVVGLCGLAFTALHDATDGLGTHVGTHLSNKTVE
ncbi:MAG: hypothetical protein AB7S99_10985 [Pseudodonghicola sp.]